MIFTSARLALADVFSPPFRATLWKTLGLTLLVLIGLWFGIDVLFEWLALPFLTDLMPDMPHWVDQAGTLAGWAAGLALAVGLAFLIGPISAIIAGLFLDDAAALIERGSYPRAPEGQEMPVLRSIVLRRRSSRQSLRPVSAPDTGRQSDRLLHGQWLSARPGIFRIRGPAIP